jgi:hypothetical protein
VNAGASEESTAAGRGPAVVEGGAVVGQEVAVDVVVQRFASAAITPITNARVGVGGEPSMEIRRCAPMLRAGSVIHASQGGDMVLRNRKSTASKPEAATDAWPVSRATRCVCIAGTSAVGLGEHATRVEAGHIEQSRGRWRLYAA